jgi:hypothetical protein
MFDVKELVLYFLGGSFAGITLLLLFCFVKWRNDEATNRELQNVQKTVYGILIFLLIGATTFRATQVFFFFLGIMAMLALPTIFEKAKETIKKLQSWIALRKSRYLRDLDEEMEKFLAEK